MAKIVDKEREILAQFMSEKPPKTCIGNYRIEGKRLRYRAQTSDEIKYWYDAETFKARKSEIKQKLAETDGRLLQNGKHIMLEALTENSHSRDLRLQYYQYNEIACKTAAGIVGNSSNLELVGRTVSYGNVSENRHETEIQREIKRQGAVMVPFDLVAGDVSTFAMVNAMDGARVFEVAGHRYLQGIDASHANRNTFLNEVPATVDKISSAYEALKPPEVVDAEARGLYVQRQGCMFFVPVPVPVLPVLTAQEKIFILAAKAMDGYSSALDASDVQLLTGLTVGDETDFKNTASALLLKIPRQRALKNAAIDECITLDGRVYCRGNVVRANFATVELPAWHLAVERVRYEGGAK